MFDSLSDKLRVAFDGRGQNKLTERRERLPGRSGWRCEADVNFKVVKVRRRSRPTRPRLRVLQSLTPAQQFIKSSEELTSLMGSASTKLASLHDTRSS